MPTNISTAEWPNYLGTRIGIFRSSADAMYVVAWNVFPAMGVFRSVDNGVTWTVQDTANAPNAGNSSALDVVQIGDTLHIAFLPQSQGAALAVIPFNMATNTFGTRTANGPVAASLHIAGMRVVFLAVRSDGSYVVGYHDAGEAVMGTTYRRAKLARYSAGAWTSGIDVGGTGVAAHYDWRTILLGAGDRVHCFYTASATTSGTTATIGLNTRTYLSTNAFNSTTATNIDSSVAVSANYTCAVPTLKATELIVPYVDSTNELRAARATSVDTPTWSTAQAMTPTTTTNPESGLSAPGVLATIDGTVHLMYPIVTTRNLYRTNDGGTGTWATPSLVAGNATVSAEQATSNQESRFSSTARFAQSFQVSGALTINAVGLLLTRTGNPFGRLRVVIADSLTGTPLQTAFFPGQNVSQGSQAWHSITFDADISLAANTTYYIRVSHEDVVQDETLNYIVWRQATGNTYANGAAFTSTDGTTWTAMASDIDFAFRVPAQITTDVRGVNIGPIQSGIGIIYGNGGVIQYDRYFLPVNALRNPDLSRVLLINSQHNGTTTTKHTAVNDKPDRVIIVYVTVKANVNAAVTYTIDIASGDVGGTLAHLVQHAGATDTVGDLDAFEYQYLRTGASDFGVTVTTSVACYVEVGYVLTDATTARGY